MKPLTDIQSADLSKRKLVVCIHGLNNNPAQFKNIIDEIMNAPVLVDALFETQ